MPVPDDLDLLVDAARDAGEIARGYWRRSPEIWDKPDGAGPVSAADLAVNASLHETLGHARPDYGWLSEESEDDKARLDAERVFIVDPIDGTRAFIEGEHSWAHSIAVAEHGRIVAAVVYLPMLDRLFSARAGKGAWLNGVKIHASTRSEVDGAELLAARPTFDPANWKDAQVPAFRRGFRSSLAYRICLVAQGRFDAMLTLRATWEWDVAAGALILSEAGGVITDRRLAEIRFNSEGLLINGVVASGGALHAPLGARLSQA